MSFYQPSLSLYDVLNALSDRAGVAGDESRQNGIPVQRNSGRSPYATANQRRNGGGTSSERRSYPPNRYYYTVPSTSYYQPTFVPSEETERPQLRPFHTSYPFSTSHPPSGRYGRYRDGHSGSYRGDDLIEALLGALVGDQGDYQNSTYSDEEQDNFGDSKAEEEVEGEGTVNQEESSDAEIVDELTKATEAGENVPEGFVVQGTDAENENGKDEQEEESNSARPKVESEFVLSEKEPTKKSKTSGASLRHDNSPIPVALQVSNPEIRIGMPFSPEVNVYETPEQYLVILALPGASSREFQIDYHPSTHEMLIKGTVQNKICVDQKYVKISELKSGPFKRSVKFPVLPRIDDEEIKASYSNGLLQIKVPKLPQDSQNPKPKKRIVIEDIPDEELEFESSAHNVPEE